MSKKNRKILVNIISQTFFVMFCIISICLFWSIISLGIIPEKYLIPGLAIIFFVYLLIGIFVYKKNIKSGIKIFCTFICLILTMLYLLIFNYLNSTLDFMEMIKSKFFQIEHYYVIVNNDSNYKDINDVDTVGIYNANISMYEDVLDKLSKEISYNKIEYTSYTNLIDALFTNEVDALLMSAANMSAVTEIITDFEAKTKIIYTIEQKVENTQEVSNVDVTEEPFNIYISGIDVYGDINIVSRSDVNMIVTVNPKTHEVLLTSIPRDYYVELPGTNGAKDKLTHAGVYGIDMSVGAIEDLLDIDIDYYVRLNFSAVVNLVDAIGGIEVYSDASIVTFDSHCVIPQGKVTLDGKCALAYSRERKSYIDGDRHRVRNQQDVIKAIANKMLSSTTLITKYNQILESMGNSFQTNIPSKSIYDLINKQLSDMPSWNIKTYSLNGFDSSGYTYSFGEELLYVMEPDQTTIEEAKQKIKLMMTN